MTHDDDQELRNRRAWDNKLRVSTVVAALVSSVWGFVVWLSALLVTESELQEFKDQTQEALQEQRYYTDYRTARLRLEIVEALIVEYEEEIVAGKTLTPFQHRDYESLIKEQERLKLEVEDLAETF